MLIVLQALFVVVAIFIFIRLAFYMKADKVIITMPDNYRELLKDYVQFYWRLDEEDKKLLEKSLKWAKRSVRLEKIQYHQFLVAQLYGKLKNRSAALKAANIAIDLGKKAGENTDEVSTFIKGMN